jgi:hypothetical protein
VVQRIGCDDGDRLDRRYPTLQLPFGLLIHPETPAAVVVTAVFELRTVGEQLWAGLTTSSSVDDENRRFGRQNLAHLFELFFRSIQTIQSVSFWLSCYYRSEAQKWIALPPCCSFWGSLWYVRRCSFPPSPYICCSVTKILPTNCCTLGLEFHCFCFSRAWCSYC